MDPAERETKEEKLIATVEKSVCYVVNRYEVRLPFKENVVVIPLNSESALH